MLAGQSSMVFVWIQIVVHHTPIFRRSTGPMIIVAETTTVQNHFKLSFWQHFQPQFHRFFLFFPMFSYFFPPTSSPSLAFVKPWPQVTRSRWISRRMRPIRASLRRIVQWIRKATRLGAGDVLILFAESSKISKIHGYGSIPINTIFSGMNIHLPAILMFTRGTRFWHTAISKIHGDSCFFLLIPYLRILWGIFFLILWDFIWDTYWDFIDPIFIYKWFCR